MDKQVLKKSLKRVNHFQEKTHAMVVSGQWSVKNRAVCMEGKMVKINFIIYIYNNIIYIYYNYLFSIILQVQGIGVKTN